MENKKMAYEAPRVIEEVLIEMDGQILQASVQGDIEIESVDTVGQESFDINEKSFVHEWE